MTTDTQKFEAAIAHHCDGLHIATGTAACCSECLSENDIEDTGDIDAMQEELYAIPDEGNFSSAQCDSCGSNLAGDRHTAHGWRQEEKLDSDSNLYHLTICVDCLLFHANGDLPETWQ